MKEIDFFVLSGQSNMQGQSECRIDRTLSEDAACEYKYLEDRLCPVRHPSGEDIIKNGKQLLLGAHQGFGSLLPAFGQGYYDECGRKSCLVHCAKGATTVANWLKTSRYDMLVEKSRAAEACLARSGYKPARKAFVWLQGESDGIEHTSKDEYKKKLILLHNSIIEDLGIDVFLIIRIAKFVDFPCLPIMAAQEELCADEKGFYMLTRVTGTFSVENGLMQGASAPFHYTNAGYDLVGDIAGRNAAKILAGKKAELETEPYPEISNYM